MAKHPRFQHRGDRAADRREPWLPVSVPYAARARSRCSCAQPGGSATSASPAQGAGSRDGVVARTPDRHSGERLLEIYPNIIEWGLSCTARTKPRAGTSTRTPARLISTRRCSSRSSSRARANGAGAPMRRATGRSRARRCTSSRTRWRSKGWLDPRERWQAEALRIELRARRAPFAGAGQRVASPAAADSLGATLE